MASPLHAENSFDPEERIGLTTEQADEALAQWVSIYDYKINTGIIGGHNNKT
jgi:hypothetical protein